MYDTLELAAIICGLEDTEDWDVVEQSLYDKYEVSMESFSKLVNALGKLTPMAQSPLTGTLFTGFVSDGVFIKKWEVDNVSGHQ